MKPGPFTYHRPSSVDEVLTLLRQHGDEAKVLSGGQSLVPMLNLRLARPETLIDINEISLNQLQVHDGVVEIGALVRHRTLEHDPTIAGQAPLLAAAAPLIGHPPIRVRGTLGGSVAHADPAAELPAVLVALDATIRVASSRGTRTVPAHSFFLGPFMTALEDDEMIVSVDVPVHGDELCVYEELAIRAGDFAVAGVAIALNLDDRRRVASARVAVSGAGATPIRIPAAEEVLAGAALEPPAFAAAGAAAAAATSPTTDVHGSADYRRHLADVLTRRGLARIAAVGGDDD